MQLLPNGLNGKDFYPFYDIVMQKDRRYSLYLYAEEKFGKLYVKFGEAKNESIYDRNNKTGLTAVNQTIKIWESCLRDTDIHPILKEQANNNHGFTWIGPVVKVNENGKETRNEMNTEEAYLIENEDGLKSLICFIETEINTTAIKPIYRSTYEDILILIDEICKARVEKYNLDLCPRWGKTSTVLELLKRWHDELDIKICIMASYVKTVRASYRNEIASYRNNSNCRFYDPDDWTGKEEQLEIDMKNWLKDKSHYCMYYVALTGTWNEAEEEYVGDDTSCFDRRTTVLKKFKHLPTMTVVEEADFGASCKKQINKIKKLYAKLNSKKFIATTGTNATKCERIFPSDKYIKRDYLVDVLNSPYRKAVKVKWNILCNAGMVETGIVPPSEMENWSSMLEVDDDGHLHEEVYVKQLLTWLFKPEYSYALPRHAQKLRDKIFNDNQATMIFTANGKATHAALKKLLENMLDDTWRIKVIDSNETSNADAEKVAQMAFEQHHNKKVIFIASGMANRSFSIPQIKNVILLMNDGCYASIAQKISRGLTYNENDVDTCNIIDFRMNYAQDNDNLRKYLSSLAIDTLNGSLTTENEIRLIEAIEASDKIVFNEYFANGQTPIKQLTADDLRIMMQSRDFMVAKAEFIMNEFIDKVHEPKICSFERQDGNAVSALANNNFKGDAGRKGGKIIVHQKSRSTEDAVEAENVDKKKQHFLFLINNLDWFNTYRFEDKDNWLTAEFNSMSENRKHYYEKILGMDMTTMTDIVKLLDKHNVKFSLVDKEYHRLKQMLAS